MIDSLPTETVTEHPVMALAANVATRDQLLECVYTLRAQKEVLRGSLKELIEILSVIEDMKDSNGDLLLYSTYPDPFGAINDARELAGLPRRPTP